jgi:hypothetical protein
MPDPAAIAASLGHYEVNDLMWLDKKSPRVMRFGTMWLALLDNRRLATVDRGKDGVAYAITPFGRAVAAAIRERK